MQEWKKIQHVARISNYFSISSQTALHHEKNRIAYCRYAASAGSLVVHTVLIIFLIRCYRNFGMGLKEKGKASFNCNYLPFQ